MDWVGWVCDVFFLLIYIYKVYPFFFFSFFSLYWSRMLMQCSLSGIKYALKMEGLGPKRVENWNMAVLINHILNMSTQAGFLWVA